MRVVLTGVSGQLGAYVGDELAKQGHVPIPWSGGAEGERWGRRFRPVDLTRPELIRSALDDDAPDAVLHLAAISAAEAVRLDPERGRAVNVEGTRIVAEWCGERGRRLLYTSTDLVFDGSAPWRSEEDPAEPVLAYGKSKRDAEPFVTALADGLVVRVCLLYGFERCGRIGYFDKTILGLKRGEPQTMFEDEFRTPLDLGSAARGLVGLLGTDARGVVHLAGAERMSRFDLIRRAAEALGLDTSLVRANRRSDVVFPEPRPADVSLKTDKLLGLLPEFRSSIEDALKQHGG